MGALWSEDYEKVFGKPTKWSLFLEDEEAYEAFRQTIIDSPHYVYDKNKLPFTGVKIYGYDLYLLKLTIDQKKAEGKKLFYIKDETPGLAKVLAFGYFNKNSQLFYLLANSLIRKTDFQQKMKKDSSLYWPVYRLQAKSEIRKCDADTKDEQGRALQLELFQPEGYRMIEDVDCSASLAAAYALGQEADFTKWKGMDGKTLAETYPFYSGSYSELIDIKTTWSKLRSLKEKPTPIVEEKGTDKLSLFNKIITPLIQHKEKAAAKIIAHKRKELTEIQCFLIDEGQSEKYSARGCYYVKEETIKVFAGAMLSSDVSSTLRYSLADYQRRSFIKEHCSTKKSKYTLKEDYYFDSADTAALYVMGQIVEGLSVWMTIDGKSLEERINEEVY